MEKQISIPAGKLLPSRIREPLEYVAGRFYYRAAIMALREWSIGVENVEPRREILRRAGRPFKRRAGLTEAWQRD